MMQQELINRKAAAKLVGVSTATWDRMSAAGKTPAPLRFSQRNVKWRLQELKDWIAAGCPERMTWESITKA